MRVVYIQLVWNKLKLTDKFVVNNPKRFPQLYFQIIGNQKFWYHLFEY